MICHFTSYIRPQSISPFIASDATPLHSAPAPAADPQPGHPEGPARVEAVLERLNGPRSGSGPGTQAALPAGSASPSPHPAVQWLHSRRAAVPDELALVHPPAYLAAIRAACDKLRVRMGVFARGASQRVLRAAGSLRCRWRTALALRGGGMPCERRHGQAKGFVVRVSVMRPPHK